MPVDEEFNGNLFFPGNTPYHTMFFHSLSQSFSEGLEMIEVASNSGEWSEQTDLF